MSTTYVTMYVYVPGAKAEAIAEKKSFGNNCPIVAGKNINDEAKIGGNTPETFTFNGR